MLCKCFQFDTYVKMLRNIFSSNCILSFQSAFILHFIVSKVYEIDWLVMYVRLYGTLWFIFIFFYFYHFYVSLWILLLFVCSCPFKLSSFYVLWPNYQDSSHLIIFHQNRTRNWIYLRRQKKLQNLKLFWFSMCTNEYPPTHVVLLLLYFLKMMDFLRYFWLRISLNFS